MKVVIDAASEDELMAKVDEFLDTNLGPRIAADAYRYCPKRSEDLADSIKHEMEGHVLIVSASGSEERDYAWYVESGHRVYHPSTGELGPKVVPPQPFLRAALYQERDG